MRDNILKRECLIYLSLASVISKVSETIALLLHRFLFFGKEKNILPFLKTNLCDILYRVIFRCIETITSRFLYSRSQKRWGPTLARSSSFLASINVGISTKRFPESCDIRKILITRHTRYYVNDNPFNIDMHDPNRRILATINKHTNARILFKNR